MDAMPLAAFVDALQKKQPTPGGGAAAAAAAAIGDAAGAMQGGWDEQGGCPAPLQLPRPGDSHPFPIETA